MKRIISSKTLFAASAAAILPGVLKAAENPNIILVLADDMGVGDISAFNPDSKIRTTHLDAIAANGIRFVDAHSNSAVSTPSRYGVLTGRYSFRTSLKSWTPAGFSPALIDPRRKTVAGMLREKGYHTACIGKWHLGWDWFYGEDKEVDYTKPISNGPTSRGFDYFFGISASLDMSPYVYVENDRVTAPPDREAPEGKGLLLQRPGPQGADFEHIDVLPNIGRRSVRFIEEQKHSDKPFFLYVPLTAPHTPILPTKEYQGKSGLSPYGDFVLMIDDMMGDMVAALKKTGQWENTIFIFTSDNGCAPYAGMDVMEKRGHYASYIYRGAKADLYDGGHRVPLVISWGGRYKDLTESGLTSLTDFYATFAEMTGYALPADEAEDSFSFWPVLTRQGKSARRDMVQHSGEGMFALRSGKWKLLFCPGSGGWSYPVSNAPIIRELPPIQLYDMAADPAEEVNVQALHPEVMAELTARMRKYIEDGRSTPGEKLSNDPYRREWKQTEPFMQ